MTISFDAFNNSDHAVKHGLPAFAYTEEEFHQLENDTLFPQSWVFVGFAHQLKDVGDFAPISVGGCPLFLIRNEEGKILAFHNACRHRCLKLIDQPGNNGPLIQCPYHSWIYNLSGDLKATPFFNGADRTPPTGFSLQENGLVPVSCAVWHDWIFVNIDGQAEPLDKFVAPLVSQLGDLAIDEIKPVAMIDLGVVKTNWKLLMENFIEPYHVQFVHKTTTQQPLKDHRTIVNQHCLGSACDIEDNPHINKSETLAVTSKYLTLFPNFVLGTYAPDQVGVHLNIPVSVSETQQYRVIYVHQDRDISDHEIKQLESLWYNVHKEDHEMCERLQIGRHSVVADGGGYLSPYWEDSVRRFQELVVEATTAPSPN